MNLKYLTDKQLLKDTKQLSQDDRKLTSRILHHIKEIDSRKLYTELGYSSLFRYVVQELGYSEGSAGRRVSAARLLQEIPEIEKKIESGDLTLSNISKASDKFKEFAVTDKTLKKEILNTIENTSTRDCEKTLSEIVNPSIPMFSQPKVHAFYLSEDNFQKYEDIRALLAHHKLSRDEIFKKVFEIALNKLIDQKFKTSSTKITTTKNSRFITAAVKKAVYNRDKKCQKCGSKFALEFDHITPYSLGGKTEKENLRLLCRNCNQRQRMTSKLHGMY
jgi:Txe/YoeB family toxin of Txe-Axe toxin-antitoxin module